MPNPTVVQTAYGYGDFVNSAEQVAVFASATTPGNTILGFVWSSYTNVRYPISFTSAADTGTIAGAYASDRTFVGRIANITGGETSYKFTLDAANDFIRVWLVEVAGADTTEPIDAYVQALKSSYGTGTDQTAQNITSTVADGLLIAIAWNSDTPDIPAAGTGFTSILTTTDAAGDAARLESKALGAPGTVAATFTLAAGAYNQTVSAVVLKPAAGSLTLTQNTRFNNAQTFYSPTVTGGALALIQSSRFNNAQTFYPLVLSGGASSGGLINGIYATSFEGTENPISESNAWVRGLAEGLLWNNPKVTGGQVVGAVAMTAERYADDIGHLSTGIKTFSPNQYARATVYKASGYTGNGGTHEIELLLRFAITANNARGYEVLWGLNAAGAGYLAIVRWNGALSNYIAIYDPGVYSIAVPNHGDILEAWIRGNIITVALNGNIVSGFAAVDITSIAGTVWHDGQPGIGFWPVDGAIAESLGWQDFEARDCPEYRTALLVDENPISEGGAWTNGLATGLVWNNMRSLGGVAIGTAYANGYDDNIACLSGFGPNQFIEATVYRAPGYNPSTAHEIELMIHCTIAPNVITGYEVLVQSQGANQIVRWDGALSNFVPLTFTGWWPDVPADGDVFRVEYNAQNNMLSVFMNGVLKATVVDATHLTGNPGIAIYTHAGDSVLANMGWKSIKAGNILTIGRPASDVSAGPWAASVGSNLFLMLNEGVANDASYIVASGLGTHEGVFDNLAFPGGVIENLKIRGLSTTGHNLVVTLKQGATTILTWNITLTPTITEYVHSLTSGERASIVAGPIHYTITATT